MEISKTSWHYVLIKSIRGVKATDSSNPLFYGINLIISLSVFALFVPFIMIFMGYVSVVAGISAMKYTKGLFGLVDLSRVDTLKSILSFFELTLADQKIAFGTWIETIGSNFSSLFIVGFLGFMTIMAFGALMLFADLIPSLLCGSKKKS